MTQSPYGVVSLLQPAVKGKDQMRYTLALLLLTTSATAMRLD
jgi:hypothetical protein